MAENGSERLDRIEGALERLEQRHEALTERHEALTQTVELIAGMQRENEAAIRELSGKIEALSLTVGKLYSATERLAYVAELHERRHDRAEVTIEAILEELRRRRPDDLEKRG